MLVSSALSAALHNKAESILLFKAECANEWKCNLTYFIFTSFLKVMMIITVTIVRLSMREEQSLIRFDPTGPTDYLAQVPNNLFGCSYDL